MKHQLQTIREFVESAYEGEWASYVDRDAALTALSELEAMAGEPVYWQWRRKGHDWTLEYTFANEVQVTTDDSERRALYAIPPAQQAEAEAEPIDDNSPSELDIDPNTHPSYRNPQAEAVPSDVMRDAVRYHKLRGWMSGNVKESWQEVKNMGALCA